MQVGCIQTMSTGIVLCLQTTQSSESILGRSLCISALQCASQRLEVRAITYLFVLHAQRFTPKAGGGGQIMITVN